MQFYKPKKWLPQHSRQTKVGYTTPRITYSRQSNSATIYSPYCATWTKKTQGMLDYISDKHKQVSPTSFPWQKHHGPHTKRKNSQHELQPQGHIWKCKDTHRRYYEPSRKTHHNADAPAYRKTCYNGQRKCRGVRTALRKGLQKALSDWVECDRQDHTTSDNVWVEWTNLMGRTQDINCKTGKWQSTRSQQGAAKCIQVT